jgi:ABC-type uncharacterized transport system permease subunit
MTRFFPTTHAWRIVLELSWHIFAFLCVGLSTVAMSMLLTSDLQAWRAFFSPLAYLWNLVTLDPNSTAELAFAVRFVTLYCLAAAFIVGLRAGYFVLGLEGGLVLVVALMAVVEAIFSRAGLSSVGILLGFILAATVCVMLLRMLSLAFFRGAIDDVTPGIVLNYAAVVIVAAILIGLGLQDPQAQGVATTPRADLYAPAGTRSRSSVIEWLVAASLLVGTITHILLTHTPVGIRLRAIGANKEAANMAGIESGHVATTLALLCAALICLAALAQFAAYGRLVVDSLRGLLVPAISAALLGRMSLVGLIPGTLAMLGLTEFTIQLQTQGYPGEIAFALQGGVILIFALAFPTRGLHRNE